MHFFLRTVIAATVGCLLIVPAVAQTNTDMLIRREDPPLRGTVTKASTTEITLDAQGAPRNVPVDEVHHVIFADEPDVLRHAREARSRKDYEQAYRLLQRIAPNELERDLLRQDVQFLLADCQARAALATGQGLDDAVRALRRFVTEDPDSFHFYEAVETLGDLAMALGSYPNALRYYGQLEKSPLEEVRLRGTLLSAEACRRVGAEGLPEAVKRYESVLQTSGVQAEFLTRARLGMAICQAEIGNPAEALTLVNKLLAEIPVDDPALLAQAYVALGDCHRAAQHPKDALFAYLHVDILYPNDRPSHAAALYHLSRLWSDLGYPDRATEAQSRLRTQYPGSHWARL